MLEFVNAVVGRIHTNFFPLKVLMVITGTVVVVLDTRNTFLFYSFNLSSRLILPDRNWLVVTKLLTPFNQQ